jgi:Flp pilus assembly protein TadG
MKLRRDERGQVLVLAALWMTLLLGFLGLAVDTGFLFHARRVAQTAADCAAIAGAAELNYGDYATAAQTAATQNGVTNGTNGATVSVNPSGTTVPSPLYGAYTGKAGYVEVIITVSQPTYFMRIFTHSSSMAVNARAVATVSSDQDCLYTLNTSATDITVNGASQLNAPGCGILDDSSSSTAMSVTGSGDVTAGSVGVVGTAYTDNSGSTITPTAVSGIAPLSDPLSFLTSPISSSSSCVADPINGTYYAASANKTIGPATSTGVVCYDGLNISNGATVNLNPGIYVINGEMSFGGGATINAPGGVTFYFPSTSTGSGFVDGSLNIAGGVTVTLIAPTSGTYDGILFYQDRSDPDAAYFAGGANSTFEGILYFPDAQLNMSNGTGTKMYAPIVANTISVTGGSTFTESNYSALNSSSPLASPRLVE